MRTAPIRSERVPPSGRMITATMTKPAMRKEASAVVRPYQFFSIVGRKTEKAT